MKVVDIRKMKTNELVTSVTELRNDIAELRRKLHLGESTNVRSIRAKRKDLARMLTVMSEQLMKEAK